MLNLKLAFEVTMQLQLQVKSIEHILFNNSDVLIGYFSILRHLGGLLLLYLEEVLRLPNLRGGLGQSELSACLTHALSSALELGAH